MKTVVKHESNTKNIKKSFCYNSPMEVLQYSEEILNELNTTRREDVAKFSYYYIEMEKIDSGDTSNVNAVELDNYFGSLGLPQESIDYKVMEEGRRLNGIC